MMRRKWPKWFCQGCQKHHTVDRFIEGTTNNGSEKWCAHSIRKAIKERWNYKPDESQLNHFRTGTKP